MTEPGSRILTGCALAGNACWVVEGDLNIGHTGQRWLPPLMTTRRVQTRLCARMPLCMNPCLYSALASIPLNVTVCAYHGGAYAHPRFLTL